MSQLDHKKNTAPAKKYPYSRCRSPTHENFDLSDRRFRVHAKDKFAAFSVEHLLHEVEVRKTPDGDEKSDFTLPEFEHRAVVHAATQQTLAGNGPRLSVTVIFVVPDHNPLQRHHNACRCSADEYITRRADCSGAATLCPRPLQVVTRTVTDPELSGCGAHHTLATRGIVLHPMYQV